MNDKIDILNRSIEAKCCQLKEKVESTLSSLNMTANIEIQQTTDNHLQNSVPPISYILYGTAGLSLIGAIASESKLLCLCIAAACGFGGYKLSNTKTLAPTVKDATTNLVSLKHEVMSIVVNTVKVANNEWEDFMELKQKEIQNEISTARIEESAKDTMLAKVYLYEVIDVSISELSSLVNVSSNIIEIRQAIDLCEDKIITAIENASVKQIEKYNSITLENSNCI